VSDLLKAAADSPLLLAFLVVGGFVVWAIEKLGSVNGPLTRAFRAWQRRELRKIEARRAADASTARVAELEDEVAYLRELLAADRIPARAVHPLPRPRAHEPATTPIPRSRNSARGAVADR
jgi:hypothetical protein